MERDIVMKLLAKCLQAKPVVPLVAVSFIVVVALVVTVVNVVVTVVDVVDVTVVDVVVVTVVVVSPGNRARIGPHPPMACPKGLTMLNNQPPENPPSQKATLPPSVITTPGGLVVCEPMAKRHSLGVMQVQLVVLARPVSKELLVKVTP